jgi:hypothetical protein
MRIRLTTDRAGVTFYQRAGEIINVSTDEALRLFAADAAEPVEDEPETAAVAPSRNAARVRRPGRSSKQSK